MKFLHVTVIFVAVLWGLGPEVMALDSFLCYKAKTATGSPTFQPRTVTLEGLTLEGLFTNGNAKVKKPERLCTPADKEGEGIMDANLHLEGYKIRGPKAKPLFPIFNDVTNAFGNLFFQATLRADFLFVPTAKGLVDPPEPPDPNSHRVDHYRCYKTPGVAQIEGFQPLDVSVADQFTLPSGKVFAVGKPVRLCNPVRKNGEGIHNREAHLMCYQVKTTSPTRVSGIYVHNQFGPEVLDLQREAELCIPSELVQALP